MIDDLIKQFRETWGWTTEEINDVRNAIAIYAMAAMTDSQVRKEVEDICFHGDKKTSK